MWPEPCHVVGERRWRVSRCADRACDLAYRGGLRGLLDVQRLLPQDLSFRARIVGPGRCRGPRRAFSSTAGTRQRIGLPLGEVVGGDQLRP